MERIIAPTLTLNNGNKIPMLGLGTYQSKLREAVEIVKEAVEVGYRHFDTAMIYGNEKEVGEGLRAAMDKGRVKREELFVTSKLWNNKHRPELVEGACRKTCADLGLNYVDLYIIHWPVAFQVTDDPVPKDTQGNFLTEYVDVRDTYKALERCVHLGLAKNIGVSNFNSGQLTRVLEVASIKPIVNQVECHPYFQQDKLIEFCEERGVKVVGFCPLGAPARVPPAKRAPLKAETVLKLAEKYNKTPAQIDLRFLIQKGVVAIPKTIQKHRLRENINIFNFELSNEDFTLLKKMDSKDDRISTYELARHDKNYPFHAEF